MARTRVSVEELLLRHRAIDEEQLRTARAEQKRVGGDLGRVLVDLGYVSEDLLLRAQAHQLGIPLVNPEQSPPPLELARALPEQVCKRYGIIPVGGNLETKLLRVATSAPGNFERLATLAHEVGFRIESAAATASSIERAIKAAFSTSSAFGELGGDLGDPSEVDFDAPSQPELEPELELEPDELGELRARVERLEKMLSNPQYAALTARVERLEQIAERDHRALNVFGQVLLDLGFISREELKTRLAKP
jgi:hypothetical protein